MPLKINWVLLKALFPVTDVQFGPPGMLDMPERCRLSIHRAVLNLEHTLGIRLNAFSDSQIVLKLTMLSYLNICRENHQAFTLQPSDTDKKGLASVSPFRLMHFSRSHQRP